MGQGSTESMKFAVDLLDRAMANPHGVEVRFANPRNASKLRQHLYTVRARDRAKSIKTYPIGDPNHGVSGWDPLIIELTDDKCGMKIFKSSQEASGVLEVRDV